MPTGLSVPINVNKGGGAKVQSEDTQIDKLVVLALQEGEDDNPFQDLGISQTILYRVNDDGAKFDAKTEIERVLKSFNGRIQIVDGIKISESETDPQTEEGELHVNFEYINLDTNEANEFSAPFRDLGE